MKTSFTAIAIAITFVASGFVSSEADARSRNRSTSHSNARSNRQPTRTARKPARTVRRPVRTVRRPLRTVRKPVRHVRKPVRHVRKPVRHVRKPVRTVRRPVRHVRKPVRRHPAPVVRYYRPVYTPAMSTVSLTNAHGFAIGVEIRAGNSALCSANPSEGSFSLGAGGTATVSTPAAYVCYRRLPTPWAAGSGWIRALVNARFMSLQF